MRTDIIKDINELKKGGVLMKVYIEFYSKNDNQGYYLTFESIEDYLKHSKTFANVPALVSIRDGEIAIRLTEPIYHTGDYTNIPPRKYPRYTPKVNKDFVTK